MCMRACICNYAFWILVCTVCTYVCGPRKGNESEWPCKARGRGRAGRAQRGDKNGQSSRRARRYGLFLSFLLINWWLAAGGQFLIRRAGTTGSPGAIIWPVWTVAAFCQGGWGCTNDELWQGVRVWQGFVCVHCGWHHLLYVLLVCWLL